MKALALFALAFLTACATPLQPLRTGYATASAYVDYTTVQLSRGQITPAEARKASENAKAMKAALDTATTALVGCSADPCQPYLTAIQAIQPMLLQMEADLAKGKK